MWRSIVRGGTMLLLAVLAGNQVLAQEADETTKPQNTKVAAPPPVPSPELADEQELQQRARKSLERELRSRQKIEAALDQETSVDVIEVPFGEVIRDVARANGITIVLDPAGLEEAAVTPDQLVTLDLEGISLRSALRILLDPLRLAAVIRNEVLEITSLDCSEARAAVRTFPVGELLSRLEDPAELTTTLELVLPDTARIDRDRDCQPKFRLVANYLVVRGSPRHHQLTEQFLHGIALGKKPLEEVRRVEKIQEGDPAK